MIQNMSLAGLAAETKAEFAYTGAYTLKQITSGGVTYDLYTLTGSGTLTVTGTAKNVAIWGCGGGSSGSGGSGGAGAYCAQLDAQTMTGEYSVTVGAATGNTSVAQGGTAILNANGVRYTTSGGTGGGGKGGAGGKGDGVTKYPFGDSTTFQCHCAGGGGGGDNYFGYINNYWGEQETVSSYDSGGSGGTNGGAGASGSSSGSYGGSGGNYGGGNGGSGRSSSSANGSDATFYGSGGGGYGNYHADPSVGIQGGTSGFGYQGVVYIRVPV